MNLLYSKLSILSRRDFKRILCVCTLNERFPRSIFERTFYSNQIRDFPYENTLSRRRISNDLLLKSIREYCSGKGCTNFGHGRLKPGELRYSILFWGCGFTIFIIVVNFIVMLTLDE